LFRLQWKTDIDFTHNIVRLGARKNKKRVVKYEWVPIPHDARLALVHFWENRLDEAQKYVLVIKHKNQFQGQPYTERTKLLPRYCKKANVRSFGYHAMRRVYIQTLGESGAVRINQLRMLARHSSLATASKYSHTPDAALHDAAHHAGRDALKQRAAAKARQATPTPISSDKGRRRKAKGT
jgi:integrase